MKNLITIILVAINLVFAHSDGWMNEGMMHGNGYSYLIFIGIIILLIFGIPFIMRNSKYKNSDTPIEILNKRLANGEINIEEFKKLKKNITE
ncbi:MAG: SHOCT domain-containing protein [Desulfobacteraceae bacterium]|jgi:uncharacterized membrane protein|nr:SHOCT domain-containing protein [Desulfobacteraceae bacterium]